MAGGFVASMPRNRQPEAQIQRAVVQHLRCCRGTRDAVFWQVPNAGARRKIEAAILKGRGVRAGVADIYIVHAGRFYALELKAPGRRATPAQMAFRAEINAAGGFATEAAGWDAAIRVLEYWGLLQVTTQ
jgi:hypothetical protein